MVISTAPGIITGPIHLGNILLRLRRRFGCHRAVRGVNFFGASGSHSCSQNSVAIMLSTNHKSSRRIAGAFVALLAVFLVQGVLAASAAAPLSDSEKIQALIRTVEARKDLQFIRLDVAHSAREAANVLRIKLAFAGDRVKTVDDFIDHVATATQSGKPYYVRYPDGREVTSAEFLRQELKRIEHPSAARRATKR